MKRSQLLLLACLLLAISLNAQIIDFPDPNFKSALLANDPPIDTNGDGEISIAEAAVVTVLEITDSGFAIVDFTGLSNFNALNVLEISAQDPNTIDLSFISEIQDLTIGFCPPLTSIDLSSLTRVTGVLTIRNNGSLSAIDLPLLQQVGGLSFTTLGSLNSVNLSALEQVDDYLGIGNTEISSSIVFTNLERAAEIVFTQNDFLPGLSFPILTEVFKVGDNRGRVSLVLNSALNTLEFPLLERVEDEIFYNGNDLITTVDYPNLESVGDRFTVLSDRLQTINLPSLVTIGDDASFRSSFRNITGNFPVLQAVTRRLFFENVESLNIPLLETAESVTVTDGPVTSLSLPSLMSVEMFNVLDNDISTLSIPLLETVSQQFAVVNTQISDLSIPSMSGPTLNFFVDGNNLSTIDFPENYGPVQLFSGNDNSFADLDLSTIMPQTVRLNSNNLINLNVKDGEHIIDLELESNPGLLYVCVDAVESVYVQEILDGYGYTETLVGRYCNFTPGGEYYTVRGDIQLELPGADCETFDYLGTSIGFEISSDSGTETFYSDVNGVYEIYLTDPGLYTITPNNDLEGLFTILPEAVTVNIPDDIPDIDVPLIADFCLTPTAASSDVSVLILPIVPARPGFEATYRVVYKNLGNTVLDGQVIFNYDDSVMDFVSASETVFDSSDGELIFEYFDLNPFEVRSIDIVLNVNAPTDTPPVNIDDILSFTVLITPNPDDFPQNNEFEFDQTVVGAYDPNDKTCLQGETITTEEVGEFVDYLIRFENTGTAEAVNIVVTDTIITEYFDLESLRVVGGSHDFVTRVDNNFVEFIFEDINLPFDDDNNDGYVLFSIRTLETLELGDSFSNKASIYFDFNFPIITNKAITLVEKPLSVVDFDSRAVSLYPNPANELLQISLDDDLSLRSVQVYSLQGQLLIGQQGASNSINVSSLSSGLYFVQIQTDKGNLTKRILKN